MKTLNILLEITIYSGILFCAIMLLKRCFKNRMSPFLHLVIWGLLIARLLIPVTLESSVHLFVIPAEAQNATMQEQSQLPVSNSDAAPNTDIFGSAQSQPQTNGQQTQTATTPAPTSIVPNQKPLVLLTEEILLAVWLTGAGIALLYLVALYGVLRRRIRANAQPPSMRLLELFAEVKTELNIKRDVKIIGQCEYGTPAILFPNTVLMPIGTLVSMRDDEVKFVLRHELMHFKRGDHILGLVLAVLNAVYWFNPIVWIAFKQIRNDMETACDSDVVRVFSSDEKTTYAAVILSLFSKKQYGNLVLGMVQGNTRQIAEKRIRGVFMNHRSNRKVKITAILLTGLLLFTCFTTACQPTPSEQIVIGKGDDTLESAIAATPAPESALVQNGEAKMVVSEHWTDKVANELTTVNIEADVLMPNVTAYPVYEVSPLVADTALVQKFVDYVAQDAVEIRNGSTMSKEELENSIARLRVEIAQVEAGIQAPDDALSPEERTANLKSQLETAEKEYAKITAEGDASGKPLDYTFLQYSTDQYTNTLVFTADMKDGSTWSLEFSISNEGEVPHSYLTIMNESESEDVVGSSVPSDEARTLALKAIKELDVGEFILGYESTNEISNLLYFYRLYDGIPVTSIDTGEGSGASVTVEEPAYNYVLRQENLRIIVNSTGIVSINWECPCGVIRKLNENVSLMSLDEIKKVFKQQILYNVYDGDGEENTLLINQIRLGYMVIPEKDNQTNYRVIPVWDFIGPASTDQQAIDEAARHGFDLAYPVSHLTINAIDGSIVDRRLGY